jgi:hypothetical protein
MRNQMYIKILIRRSFQKPIFSVISQNEAAILKFFNYYEKKLLELNKTKKS